MTQTNEDEDEIYTQVHPERYRSIQETSERGSYQKGG